MGRKSDQIDKPEKTLTTSNSEPNFILVMRLMEFKDIDIYGH